MEAKRQYLCLLPSPPRPASYTALHAAYSSVICEALKHASKSPITSAQGAILEIALSCPLLDGTRGTVRRQSYDGTQALLAGLYRLTCAIAERESINVEDSSGVDARVIMLAKSNNDPCQTTDGSLTTNTTEGPVIDLGNLAASGRSWSTIFSVESEEGERMLRGFLSFNAAEHNIVRVGGGTVLTSQNDASIYADAHSRPSDGRRHFAVAVGGTFDHLHIGHKLLLTMTAFVVEPPVAGVENERSLTIGITGDELLKNKKYAEYLESWADRQEATACFLKAIIDFTAPDKNGTSVEERNEPGPNGKAVIMRLPSSLHIKFVEIWDPFGPTITDESISALVISAETRSGGQAVNEKRREKGWHALEIFEVDVLDANSAVIEKDNRTETTVIDFQDKLSSTRIRKKLSDHATSHIEAGDGMT